MTKNVSKREKNAKKKENCANRHDHIYHSQVIAHNIAVSAEVLYPYLSSNSQFSKHFPRLAAILALF